ncbi:diguanylate cyclase domain-containing protein [Azohydromonas aeria]|uniref:diguanylate cyclase domain-containing protein n=1 Tax=Azohydromonas aeria TaxID=2590212 RepID=UPI001E551930|nr:diguanylate cyclase [Azohydromonas aeria]
MDKILIVDDDPVMIRALGRILGDYPGRQFAMSGSSAIEQALADPPDLMLLDAQLPDLSGFAVCKRLKADARFSRMPVIFITGQGDRDTEAMVFELGACDFIAKPVNPLVLQARVATQLRMRRMTAELERLAHTDELTGLANRHVFDDRLSLECRRAAHGGQPLALVMVDVDHFKAYNDHYGHPAGDACLREIAAVLRGCMQRPGGLVARWGGEEFALLLPATDAAGCAAVVQRLLQALALRALPHARSACGPHVTASVGVACLAPGVHAPPDMAGQLLARADGALYAAKAQGRAQCWLVPPGQDRAELLVVPRPHSAWVTGTLAC